MGRPHDRMASRCCHGRHTIHPQQIVGGQTMHFPPVSLMLTPEHASPEQVQVALSGSTERSAVTRRMNPPPIQTPFWCAKAAGSQAQLQRESADGEPQRINHHD